MCTLEWLRRKHKMSKKIKHTPAAIFDMLEELQLSLEILEEKMDNIYDIVKSKPQKDGGSTPFNIRSLYLRLQYISGTLKRKRKRHKKNMPRVNLKYRAMPTPKSDSCSEDSLQP